jgi:hypothetical protein
MPGTADAIIWYRSALIYLAKNRLHDRILVYADAAFVYGILVFGELFYLP